MFKPVGTFTSFVVLFLLCASFATRCNGQLITEEPVEGTVIGPVQAVEIYRPYADPTIRFAEHCAQWVTEELFGWSDLQASFDLRLDEAFDPADPVVLSGSSHLNQPFSIEFGMFSSRDLAPGASPAGTTRFAIWEGVIASAVRGSNHAVVVHGFYVEGPLGVKIIPMIARIDQALAMDIHGTLVDAGGFFAPRISRCILDDAALFQQELNGINARACWESCRATAAGFAASCLVIGTGSCLWSFGAGCVAAAVCEVTILVDSIRFQKNHATEWNRAEACLCAETQWRNEHPGQPTPSACGTFVCPTCPNPLSILFG